MCQRSKVNSIFVVPLNDFGGVLGTVLKPSPLGEAQKEVINEGDNDTILTVGTGILDCPKKMTRRGGDPFPMVRGC